MDLASGRRVKWAFAAIAPLVWAGVAAGATVPFTEEFVADSANWRSSDGVTPLGWSATGDPKGTSYAFATFNFASSAANDTPAIYRAHAAYGSSSGAFAGNWIADVPVSGFRVSVRHNTGVPLTFFARFAEPANFPAAASVIPTAVPSGQWTTLAIPIPDPSFIFELPGQTFADLFDNIGNVQIGVVVPASLAGVNQAFTFDIDKASVSTSIPTVSEWGVVTMALLILTAGTLLLHRGTTSTVALARIRRPRTSNTLAAVMVAVLGALASAPRAEAAIVPFTETFAADSANWRDSSGLTPLGWVNTGGPDGSGFAGTTFNFLNSAANDTPVLFRAQDEFDSSAGAFEGNWVTDGVTGFGAAVRHDAPVPLNFFVRFASPNNFPGAANVFFIPVPANTWTDLSAALPNPNLIFEGPFTYEQVFGNIGHVQLGVSVPEGLAGTDAAFHFDLDNVRIVPEPASLGLLAIGAVTLVWRRRIR